MRRRAPKPSADVFAVADRVPNPAFLTAGKLYKVSAAKFFEGEEFDLDQGFIITDDEGDDLFCLWEGCAHLDHRDWRRVTADGGAA